MNVHEIITASHDAMERGILVIWTIYDKPKDYPEGIIARRFEIGKGAVLATTDTVTGSLEKIRASFTLAGLTRLPRQAEDDRNIVECWV